VLFTEALVARGALRADTRHRDACPGQLPVQIPYRAGLARTPRREVRRVEVEDGRSVLEQCREGDVVTVLVRQREFRGLVVGIQHVPDIKSVSLAGTSPLP
jgi:hypothetical protein